MLFISDSQAPDFVFSIMKCLPTKRLKRISSYMTVVTSVADEIVRKQTSLYREGKEGSRDLMSILVRANLSENPKSRLSKMQVLSQLTTFFFAGHETTATTMSWILYELTRHPQYQTKLREEITSMRAKPVQNKQDEIIAADLDAMHYLNAIIKVRIPIHRGYKNDDDAHLEGNSPFSSNYSGIIWEMRKDMVIPLSEPIKTTTGEVITSIPVEHGQQMFFGILTYNRLKSGGARANHRPQHLVQQVFSY